MQMNKVAIIVVGCCVMSALTGCGVKKEIHQGVLDQLSAANLQISTLSEKLTEENSKLVSEQAKMRATTSKLEQYEMDNDALKKREVEISRALADSNMAISTMEKALIESEEKVIAEVAKKKTAETKLSELMDEYQTLLDKYTQYKKNVESLSRISATPAKPAPATVDEPAAAANPQDLLDLLNSMN